MKFKLKRLEHQRKNSKTLINDFRREISLPVLIHLLPQHICTKLMCNSFQFGWNKKKNFYWNLFETLFASISLCVPLNCLICSFSSTTRYFPSQFLRLCAEKLDFFSTQKHTSMFSEQKFERQPKCLMETVVFRVECTMIL